VVVEVAAAGPVAPAPVAPKPEAPKPRVVLHIGDSMVGYGHGLSLAMKKRYAAEAVEYHYDAWTSAQVQTIDDKRMDKLLGMFKPDLVLFNLGTNNLSVPHPEALASGIREIAKHLAQGGRTCVWIAPIRPKWKYNPKMYDVLRENVAPCKYFDAGDIDPPLQTDHIHPTDAGGEQWAAPLWDFLRQTASQAT
jgi:lysophospholipase L1-like esterase